MHQFPFRRRAASPAAQADLTICRSCGSGYVIPAEWEAREEAAWWIRLRCGERCDRRLEEGVQEIARALHRHELEQMASDAEKFATALELDLLDAADFAR